ncbi:MAG TPA: class A beta-lactamase [Steroidobacteraceae bacterium]|nr:class A beta-lactamase [Steroidobacteraceae bacterium]
MLTRRRLLALSLLALPELGLSRARFAALPAMFEELERRNGGRVGVTVLDTATGEVVQHRGSERFAMCSTFKFLLAAAVLQRIERHQESADRPIAIPDAPLLSHSPLTAPHAGATMPILQLCQAIVTQSDNTAANLLLGTLGGPPGITAFARSIGDGVTRLDRTELALNEALAGDPRDTTTPAAMASNLHGIIVGSVLSAPSRDRLTSWMVACETGLDRLRADLPSGWRAADKTGTNGTHTSNDIAVLWPPNRPPLIVAAYITQCPGPESKRTRMLAQIGRLIRQ